MLLPLTKQIITSQHFSIDTTEFARLSLSAVVSHTNVSNHRDYYFWEGKVLCLLLDGEAVA
jgi:hypothetical protein